MGNWLYQLFGLGNLSGPYYGFWSGAGSDLTELAIVGGMINMARRYNCHQRWCFAIGHHEFLDVTTGLTHRLCRRHHPDHPGRRAIDFRRRSATS